MTAGKNGKPSIFKKWHFASTDGSSLVVPISHTEAVIRQKANNSFKVYINPNGNLEAVCVNQTEIGEISRDLERAGMSLKTV